MSKPTWRNTLGCSATSAFFFACHERLKDVGQGLRMDPDSRIANFDRGSLGHGSQFSVSLPTCSARTTDAADAQKHRVAAIRRRVLLIDDRRDAILPTKIMLELFGHEVSIASDGLSGIVLARQIVPEVILCDIGLPGEMDGYDVAAAVRSDATLRDVYVVAVSGYGREEDRQRCRDAGFNYHLTKPVSTSDLEAVMANLPGFRG